MEESKNYVLFLDNVGRTIMGKSYTSSSGAATLAIVNPTTILVGFNEQQQPKAQMLPVFFRDLMEDPNQSTLVYYNIAQITVMDVVPSKSLIKSYESLHAKIDIKEHGIDVVEKEIK